MSKNFVDLPDLCNHGIAALQTLANRMRDLPGYLQRLRKQVLEAIPGVPEKPTASSVPHQITVALGRCLVVDEPIGPIHHRRLAPVARVSRVPRRTGHERVSATINNIGDEIGMSVEPALDVIRGLIQSRSAQERESAER